MPEGSSAWKYPVAGMQLYEKQLNFKKIDSMKKLLLICFILSTAELLAQHCPWDCSGMVLVSSAITPAEYKKLQPVLVDSNKNVLISEYSVTGKMIPDTNFLFSYEDFMADRTIKIATFSWYVYDTIYHFAKGHFLARFNHCRFSRQQAKLFIRFNDVSGASAVSGAYHFIPVPLDKRIHLHDHQALFWDKNISAMQEAVKPFVMNIERKEWFIRPGNQR